MTPVNSVRCLLEIGLYVKDLDRSQAFYQTLFNFPEVFREEGRLRALGIRGKQVLLLFHVGASVRPTPSSGGLIPAHDARGNQHFAFAVGEDEYEFWWDRLVTLGIPVESEVRPPQGGWSLYFRDPDGHAVELATPRIWFH